MKILKLAGMLIGVCLIFYSGYRLSTFEKVGQNVRSITLEDYHELKDSGTAFVLYIERPSCRYCAIVSSHIFTMKNPPLPVYYINLEPFWGRDEYEILKKELKTVYLPCFKYISHGEIQYNLNSPLDSSYFDLDGPARMELYVKMQEKINAFLNGAVGQGPPINEAPVSGDTIVAIPVKPTNQENNYD